MQNPDTLKILDPRNIENPYPLYETLRKTDPVHRIPGTEVYLVSDRALIEQALNQHEVFSANLTGVLVTSPSGEPDLFNLSDFGSVVDAIANADEPNHAIHRKLVLPYVTPSRTAAMEDEIRHWAAERIGGLIQAGGGDWVAQVANPIPTRAMARLVGLPIADADQLLAWALDGTEILAGATTMDRMGVIGTSAAEMSQYLSEKLQEALDAPEESKPPGIIANLALGVRDHRIPREAAVSILVVLAGAGAESTAGLTGSAARLLAQSPQIQERLRAEPDLIPRFVEEALRLESPFKGHYRVAIRETELGGTRIKKDARLLLLWAAANRDPNQFTDPNEIDLNRPNPQEHIAFGRGIHFCVGARLARLEARIILEELLSRTLHFEIDPNDPPRHVPSIFVRRLQSLALRISS